MERLEMPHHAYPCVLIAGTNGKGSVTAILESVLAASNEYQVGATISPHLVNLNERIRIQKEPLPDDLWIKGVEALQMASKIMGKEPSIGSPSFFELVTALAFWAFRETERDLAVVEVGLGGRLDATNVCRPELSVITNIGTDHQELLGPDKPSIAREKLGILHHKGTLITAETDPSLLALFEATCQEKKARLFPVPDYCGFSLLESTARGHLVRLSETGGEVHFPLPGRHQLSNLSLTLQAVERLRANGFQISADAVTEGIATVSWPGRLHWVNSEPPVLLDGAHNHEGMASLISFLRDFPMPRPCHLIFGALQNKPVAAMAQDLAQFADTLSFVPPSTNRAVTFEEFQSVIFPTDDRWLWKDTLAEALATGSQSASIVVSGSLYLVADYLKRAARPS